jgi:AraC-like DNA-binding protein
MVFNISFCTGVLGLFLAIPLMLSNKKRHGNIWLGLFILSLSLLSQQWIYFKYPQYMFGVFDWPLAGLGAFFYCYVRSVVGLGNGRRQIWHFLPIILWSAVLLTARLRVEPMTVRTWLDEAGGPIFDKIVLGFELLAASYVPAVIYRIMHYRAAVRENYSSLNARDLRWMSGLSAVVLAMLVIWIPASMFGGEVLMPAFIFGRLATVFFLGWYGMHHHTVFLPQHLLHPVPPDAPAPVEAGPGAPAPTVHADADGAAEKYARSGMSDAARELIGERLRRRCAIERDHLDNDIKLTELAERIGTSPQLLSQYLNHVLGLSFFDYINGLRVAEVQRLMCDDAHADASLIDIAFSAGFNSKSTFNASFKKITGMAPSAWREQHARTSEPIG